MNDLETARKRWLAERPAYESFGREVSSRIRAAVQAQGIWCETSARAKETHSLVKKLLKGKHNYETLPDKVGARCVVRYVDELERVVELAQGLFECREVDRKLEQLGTERVGYAGIHVEVLLRPDDPIVVHYAGFRAELQIKTLGQNLWSEMSHDSVYKNDEMLATLPLGFRRRVNLMAGLIEVADQEFNRLNNELPTTDVSRLYKAMERHYFKLTTKRPDPELSFQVIDVLLPLYGADVLQITELLDAFFASHGETLHAVYEQSEDWKASALLYQPEVLMIYERLEADQLATRRQWNTRFPEGELERVANSLGISFD